MCACEKLKQMNCKRKHKLEMKERLYINITSKRVVCRRCISDVCTYILMVSSLTLSPVGDVIIITHLSFFRPLPSLTLLGLVVSGT